MEISFDDFKKLDMKVGEIIEAEKVPNSRNLLKFLVDFGNEKRLCIAGLVNFYSSDELIGKKFVFLVNLKPRKLMGLKSQCMILAAEDSRGNVVLISPETDINNGSKIG